MSASIGIVKTVRTLRQRIHAWREAGKTVALVPTMGALHEGHLSLVKLAKKKADHTVVSIFVNPKQFGPKEDLATYPRDEARDKAKLIELQTDLIYVPKPLEIYPSDFSTSVNVGKLTEGLCGVSRPHFFSGVATVVCKLLNQGLPDIAIFGEKDYQQLLVIKRMVRDLDIPVKILGGPIVREKDGLALSSRNVYLSEKERAIAPQLHKTIKDAAQKLGRGGRVSSVLSSGSRKLDTAGFRIDYLEVRSVKTLALIKGQVREPARVFVAVFLGKTRLIDNVAIPKLR